MTGHIDTVAGLELPAKMRRQGSVGFALPWHDATTRTTSAEKLCRMIIEAGRRAGGLAAVTPRAGELWVRFEFVEHKQAVLFDKIFEKIKT